MAAVTHRQTIAPDGTDRARILRAGAIAVGASVVANVILRFVLGLVITLDPAFLPFGYLPIIFFTALSTAVASALFWLLARFTKQPARIFTIIAAVVFVVTLFPNISSAGNPSSAPFPVTNPGDFLTLIWFHLPPAAISVWSLTQQTRTP